MLVSIRLCCRKACCAGWIGSRAPVSINFAHEGPRRRRATQLPAKFAVRPKYDDGPIGITIEYVIASDHRDDPNFNAGNSGYNSCWRVPMWAR